ncbi:DUF6297 family protein [Austwickia chelonae]|uniref:DUF6297 family protein n=1 Tax=Austwickia chelonae TaxID=100225 RepID=UPI000E279C63|nr:DUF6297 family protein [Austwickia chelonae]
MNTTPDHLVEERRRARTVLRELRWRRTSDQKFTDSAANTGYMLVLAALVFASMAAGLLRGSSLALENTLRSDVAALLPMILPVALAGAALWAAATAGPLGAPSAERTWLFAAPADRGVLLRSRVVSTGVLAWFVGAVLTGIAAAAAGAESTLSDWTARTTAGAGLTLWVVAAAAWRQTASPTTTAADRTSLFGTSLLVAATLAATALAALPTIGLAPPTPPSTDTTVIALTAAAVTSAGTVTLLLVARQAHRLPMSEIARGGDFTDATEQSMAMLDSAAVLQATARRNLARHGRRRSRTLTGHGLWALVAADARRVPRRPGPLLAATCTLPWLWLFTPAQGSWAGLLLAALVVIPTSTPYAAGLRAWVRSTGLRRSLPGTNRSLALAFLVVPAVVATAVAAVAQTAAHLSVWSTPLLVGAALVAMTHTASAPDLADVGLVVSTPAGALPVGVVKRVLRGSSLPALVLAPGLVMPGPMMMVAAAVGVLIAGFCLWQDLSQISGY